ncbi:MAG: ATP-binding cassette domain-containing protein, partial [Bacillota bacterium]|nr:ATP-binding cassette domain-containing protein [Bacillota bacterium]
INAKGYNRKELRRKIGMVFQYPECQLFEATVEKDVAFGLRQLDMAKEKEEENLRYALEEVGFNFESIRNQSPMSLSGGEKRRVAIAGILATRPQILILDEPIAGLDPDGRKKFLELTDRLYRSGVTIIMVSHNIDSLAEHAQRIIVMEKAAIVMDGPVHKVLANAEVLCKKDMDISQVMEVKRLLLKRGIPLPREIIRYNELLSYLKDIRKGENK